MRLVFAGTPDPAVPSLQALLASRHEVVGVLTRPDARSGRGRTLSASPVAELAEAAGIPVLKPVSSKDPEFHEQLRALQPDACPIVAYGGIVPRAALDIPPKGWINLHFSLLPAWRGAAPVQHAVLHGDDVTGASTFLLEEGLDTGPVLGTVTEQIRDTDTSGDLLVRLASSGAKLLVASLDAIEDGTADPRVQPVQGISLAPKLKVEDAFIEWSHPALSIDRRIRACTPAPGPWTTFRGARLKLGPVTTNRADFTLAPGEIAVSRSDVRVGTGSVAVVLGEVGPEGKKPMAAADWARGLRLTPGEKLGS
jgi:methionyl-tRNA formyltransferase